VSGLAAPFVGRWLDRHGPRALMTAGSLLGALLVLAWSRIQDATAFYLVWAGIGLAMAATLYEPAFATVATWFERGRGKALLLVTLAAGFASTIFLPLSGWLVGALGWRRALVALAAVLAAGTILPHALLLRRRPEDLGLRPDGDPLGPPPGSVRGDEPAGATAREALRDPAFRWLTVAFFFDTVSLVAVGVHLIPYLVERGDEPGFAASVVGLIGAAQVGARVLATVLGGRVSQVALTAGVFALQAVALLVLMGWQSRPGVLVAVLLLGAGRGVSTLMRAGLVAEFWGRAHYGAIGGLLALFLTGARALAPVGAGVAYAVAGGYIPVFRGLVACSLLAAVAMVGVGRHRRRAPPA
jgi:sugar phosphate permease